MPHPSLSHREPTGARPGLQADPPLSRSVVGEVSALLVSSGHACVGDPRGGLRPTADHTPPEVHVEAGRGIVGDRFHDSEHGADAAVTVVAGEALDEAARELGLPRFDHTRVRRNIVLRGVEVEALRRAEFALDTGDGPVVLAGRGPAAPCVWLDELVAVGLHRALRGRAGIRCAALTSGTLRRGPVEVRSAVDLDGGRAALAPRRRRA